MDAYRPLARPVPETSPLSYGARVLREHCPRFGAELLLHLLVESARLERGLEWRGVGLVERGALDPAALEVELALERLPDGSGNRRYHHARLLQRGHRALDQGLDAGVARVHRTVTVRDTDDRLATRDDGRTTIGSHCGSSGKNGKDAENRSPMVPRSDAARKLIHVTPAVRARRDTHYSSIGHRHRAASRHGRRLPAT